MTHSLTYVCSCGACTVQSEAWEPWNSPDAQVGDLDEADTVPEEIAGLDVPVLEAEQDVA